MTVSDGRELAEEIREATRRIELNLLSEKPDKV